MRKALKKAGVEFTNGKIAGVRALKIITFLLPFPTNSLIA